MCPPQELPYVHHLSETTFLKSHFFETPQEKYNRVIFLRTKSRKP